LLRAIILLCLNLAMIQGPAFGRDLSSSRQGGEWMDLNSAREYMVSLINRDRAAIGLQPVELDPVACAAGQAHSEEMALSKYVSHWDLQGRKPDQRYSEAGGQGAVSENVLVTHDFAEGENYRLAPQQLFRKSELEQMESLFFNEQAPNDGHRQNILNPSHNRVGVGLTTTLPGNRVACTQEFVNQYGNISKLPEQQQRGANLALKGELPKGMSIYSVDIYRDAQPHPMSTSELKLTHSYTMPTENVARYFPPPYLSPGHMNVSETQFGEKFSIDVKADQNWKPGLYYVVVWVKKADSVSPLVTSTQTVAIN
jgi:uncharacterized protein YkwD